MSGMIKLPAEALEGAQNFAIDFGGSVLKVVYIRKDDVQPEGFKFVHQKSFDIANFHEALDFIKTQCDIPTEVDGEPREYLLTGVGTHQFQKDLREQLNIRLSTAYELICFAEAYRVLAESLPPEELYYPPEHREDSSSVLYAEKLVKIAEYAHMGKLKDSDVQFAATCEGGSDKWPCLLGVLGSSFMFIKLNEDGTIQHNFGSSPHGGRSFLGLGSLLTGAKSYKELMDLAEKGNDRTVNLYSAEFLKPSKPSEEGEAQSIYSMFAETDGNCFSYGLCSGKSIDEFKREDLARALLANTCSDLTASCLQACRLMKVARVVLAGGFAQSPLTRKLIEGQFMGTAAMMKAMVPEASLDMSCKALRVGSYLGALGALLQSAKKTQQKDARPAK